MSKSIKKRASTVQAPSSLRQLTWIDKIIGEVDNALRTLTTPKQRASDRPNPAKKIKAAPLSISEKRHVAGLMRVNHAGEVSAQALYQGQALTAKLTHVKAQMAQAAIEEIDHLAWCEERLHELDSKPSLLNPLWYSGSLLIGALAGLIGDKWSLGFVVETERQVTEHLQKHLNHLPSQDLKTKAILNKMYDDEAHHADIASQAGAAELPFVVKQLMRGVSKLLTKSSYYI
jgi:ubiquinone biosynthesis monooxygenase Coq7